MTVAIGMIVNPMSGRDVRRLAARATNMTHEAKRDLVARAAAGADAAGVTDIYVMQEPFRIASAALEHMDLDARVHVLAHKPSNDASDTETAVVRYLQAGCRTLISIGGDGTNRAIVRALMNIGASADVGASTGDVGASTEDVHLIALSTGTNNAFPVSVEPTIAGLVAGYHASGRLLHADQVKQRAKVLHVRIGEIRDVGLIDAVLLRDDHVGNLLPFDPARLVRILLTRAEPTAIGMSPIGGLLDRLSAAEDEGLLVEMGAGIRFKAPLSPGLFREVEVQSTTRVGFGEVVPFQGPGVLALDGDRDHKLGAGMHASIALERDGPWLLDVEQAMRWVVAQGIIGSRHSVMSA